MKSFETCEKMREGYMLQESRDKCRRPVVRKLVAADFLKGCGEFLDFIF